MKNQQRRTELDMSLRPSANTRKDVYRLIPPASIWPIISLIVLVSAGSRVLAGVVQFDDSCVDGNWHTCCSIGGGNSENNWDFGPGGPCPLPLPGLADDVDLGGHTVVLNQATVAINSLTSTGEFTKAGFALNATQGIVLNEFNLSGGSMSAGGPIVINGPLNSFGGEIRRLGIPNDPPAVAQFLGGINVTTFLGLDLSGLTAVCTEDVLWQGGKFGLNEGTTFDSQATFAIECDQDMDNGAPVATFINNGTVVKRVTTGSTTIRSRAEFESFGPVNVETGTLVLQSTGFSKNTFNTSDGATLFFGQGGSDQFTLDEGTSLAGTGQVRSSSNALIIPQDVAIGANNFELLGGTLIGPGSLGVLFLNWSNGTVNGAQVEAFSTLDLNGFLTKSITTGGLVENSGQGNWTGTGSLSINNATFRNGNIFTAHSGDEALELRCSVNADGEFHNDTGATVAITGNDVRFMGGSGGAVRNDGTITTTADTLVFEVPLINDGAIQSQSGEAVIRVVGGGESTGTFETVGFFGGALVFTGLPYTLKAGTQILGDGVLRLINGEIIVPFATVPVESTYEQLGGTVSGDGDFYINSSVGVSNWFGGSMTGLGTTTIGPNTQFFITDGASPNSSKTLDQRDLIIDSPSTVFSGAGDLFLRNGARLHVLFGAKLAVSGSDGPQDIVNGSGGDDGVVTIDGELEVNNHLRVDANTIFNLHGSAILFAELWLNGGGDFTDALVSGTQALELRGGTFEFNDTSIFSVITRLKGSTIDVQTKGEVDHLELSSGFIDGPGELKIPQMIEWTGGTMKGAGKTSILGAASLTGSNRFLMQRTLNNSGSGLVWSAGTITASQGAIINNHQPFDIAGSPSLQSPDGLGVINNHSTFFKSAGAGQTNIFLPFSHAGGEVRCDAGTLRFAAGFTQTGGVTRFGTGGTLVFSQPLLLVAGIATGAGAATANIVNIGGAIRPGDSPGTLTINGDFTSGTNGLLEMEFAGLAPGTEHDVLSVTGTAALSGTLRLLPTGGFIPQVGDSFTILTAGSVTGTFDAVAGPGAYALTYNSDNVVATVTSAPACSDLSLADLNYDCTVNLDDYAVLAGCHAGPGDSTPPTGCSTAEFVTSDLDVEGDVDAADFGQFQILYAGP